MLKSSAHQKASSRTSGFITSMLVAAASLGSMSAAAQTRLTIPDANISASGSDINLPVNANDGSLSTRWSADASGGAQWLQYNLGGCYKIACANLAWYNGDSRKYNLTLQTSNDGRTWSDVFNGTNSGTTAMLKPYAFGDKSARYVRLQSTGSNVNNWVSLSEMEIWTNGTGNCSSYALDPKKSPGENFDLSGYKLQTLDGALQFKQVSPINTYTDKYFYTDSSTGAMTFYVPSGAGSTTNSHYPRSELRTNATWRMGGTRTLAVSMKVLQQPATKQIIIGQIHGEQSGGSELLKLRWTNGDILMGVKTNFGDSEQRILIKSGVAIGENIDYVIKLAGSTVTVTVNGTSKSFTYNTASWSNVDLYFKLGAYSQDSSADGTYAKVAVTALK
ncbi:polysaccharide lyase family 7 protein [Melittangium boletus]|uniref:Alginate lyase n=1 Tax=Melittangium boletus DSM 14713 TaxID=1294270 RepID=A0A250IIQ5_9BACT|nr:polysaccharide lyase family 7 protein [Melittangium boletus]ATB31635.1 alginate lyase [Melittangium boletus DSM 14713]